MPTRVGGAIAFTFTGDYMKYSIEVLDETTKLVSIIEQQLDCSFDEACEVMRTVFRKINNDEIQVDNSLKLLLPDFLQEVRDADATPN